MTYFLYSLMFQEEDPWKSGLKGKNKTDPMEGINEKED